MATTTPAKNSAMGLGLEVKREFLFGELTGRTRATLPIAAAAGGVLAPAGIYLLIAFLAPGGPGPLAGWGVPIATDIVFAVGNSAGLGVATLPARA